MHISINSYMIKLKKIILPTTFLLFSLSLVLFSKTNLEAVKSGLQLWANSVVPSLFPFFVATELLLHTSILDIMGKYLSWFMKSFFNISGKGAFAFIMGIISGYPIGAKIACEFRNQNICNKEECERLLSFTNNSGPLFIIGTVGILMFRNSAIGFLLFLSHLLAAISVGFVFRFWKTNSSSQNPIFLERKKESTNVSFKNLGTVLSESIISATKSILLIGGFVVIFSSIISILNSSKIINIISLILNPIFDFLNIDIGFSIPFINGLVEITNGINSISNILSKKISINIMLVSFLLGLGGLSIFLQVLSIVSTTDLSIKPYILGKLLQGILSSFYSYLLMLMPWFNFDL